MYNYQRILKDCFWDLDISVDDIKNIVKSGDAKKLNMLFEKILLNSTALFHDLEIFDKKQLKILLENYQIPQFNGEYAFRRKNMAEVYFFDKPLLIDELKWIA
ncbi:MAG: hypothetical protein FXF49_03855 [Flexistipes sinusarabici]|uniref:Uncharacterized protein n=1 Tax=Flexistipes sinusarabici TaxID=2352 RepID=A0A5D0MLN4_FLESI|nr:hypothetical protein [Flexistipes sinusarabici]TYB33916.1 MAG: hypothetical protein FXF49_03855 [Flexistipes sinusarabici]